MSGRRRAVPATDVDRRWVRVASVGLAIILAFALAIILLWRHGQDQDARIDRQAGNVRHLDDLASGYASAARDGKVLAAQIKAACVSKALSGSICRSASSVAAQPVPSISPTPTPVTAAPRVLVVSPTSADMARAVQAYCAPGRCSQPPTAAQVQSAFEAWCAAHAGCRGPAGKDGANGRNGTTGPAGVSVTGASQDANHHLILAFSDGTAVDVGQLPAGPPGSPGAQGEPGQNATPQPFSFSYTVSGIGPDRTYTTSCRWDPTSGYQCSTEES